MDFVCSILFVRVSPFRERFANGMSYTSYTSLEAEERTLGGDLTGSDLCGFGGVRH